MFPCLGEMVGDVDAPECALVSELFREGRVWSAKIALLVLAFV